MADLQQTTPFAGLDWPAEAAGCRLTALPVGQIHAIAPYPGQTAAVATVLGGFPAPGTVIDVRGARLVWAGRDLAFLFGAAPDLGGMAAVTDQSDGWAGMALEGEGAEAVLARLVPLDLAAMPAPAAARSLLNHLPLLLIRTNTARFEIWSYRSMAGTLIHELAEAMASVAGRLALP